MALRASGASAGSATVRWLVRLAERRRRLRRGARVRERRGHDRRRAPGARHRRPRATARPRRRAVSWLRANQNGDGGFGQFKGRDSNAQSTSYAVQGLLAAGAGGARRLARAQLPRPPPAKRRERRLLVVERADAGVGDRPGADGAQGQAAPDRHRAAQASAARAQGGVGGRRRRRGGAARRRQGRLEDRAAERSRRRSGRRRRRRRRRREPCGGATAATASPAATDPEGTTAARSRGSGDPRAAPRRPEAGAGVGGRARGRRPARAPVGAPPVRAARALARHGIVSGMSDKRPVPRRLRAPRAAARFLRLARWRRRSARTSATSTTCAAA